MGSNNNIICSSKGNPKRFMLESLNRLMADLSGMDEDHYDQFVTDVVVKEEPKDFSFVEEIPHIKQEGNIVGPDKLISDLPIKQEFDEFTSVIYGNSVRKEDYNKPQLKFLTEIIVKKEDEDLEFLNCIQDFQIKDLRIVLRRFKCFMCEHCPLFYKTKRNLLRHIHTKHFLLFQKHPVCLKSLISCIICNKKLLYRRWHEHMTTVHSIDKIQCKFCHKVFKHANYLKRHVQHIHKNSKPRWLVSISPVECPLCFKMFSNKHALHTHNKTCHSKETVTCKVCNSTLKCKTYLHAHMRRVHYNDGKMHVCHICTKSFKSPRYLKIHKKNSHYSL